MASFAATNPTASLEALADALGPDDVAAIQVGWLYLDEAKANGTMKHCARDLLVRELHARLPGGWNSRRGNVEVVLPRVHAISAWTASVSSHLPEYDLLVGAIGDRIITEDPFPEGWLPTDVDDSTLVAFFDRNWIEPDLGHRG